MNLTPAEIERLAILSEECGEVVMAIGKILRHGYDSKNPDIMNDPDKKYIDNRFDLHKEIGDVELAVKRMIEAGDIRRVSIEDHKSYKIQKPQYLHFQNQPTKKKEPKTYNSEF